MSLNNSGSGIFRLVGNMDAEKIERVGRKKI
jgi:hypothetical protein